MLQRRATNVLCCTSKKSFVLKVSRRRQHHFGLGGQPLFFTILPDALRHSHASIVCCSSQQDDLPDVSGLAMAKRFASEFQQREVQSNFDGRTLATLIQRKFGRSYDVILVQRKLMGKVFVAMNIMWRYLEQQSFTKSEEQYLRDLDDVASVLSSWGVVRQVASELQGVKSRPRVGKAVSIQLNVEPDKLAEWLNN